MCGIYLTLITSSMSWRSKNDVHRSPFWKKNSDPWSQQDVASIPEVAREDSQTVQLWQGIGKELRVKSTYTYIYIYNEYIFIYTYIHCGLSPFPVIVANESFIRDSLH